MDKLSNRYFMGVMQSDLSHNCHTESGNAALSGDVYGPKPKHGLGQSTIAIADHDDRQHDKLDKKAVKELTRNSYESEIQSAARELSRDIVDYRTDMLMDEVSSNFELVMSTYLAHHHTSLQCDSALSGWVCKEAIEEGDPNQSQGCGTCGMPILLKLASTTGLVVGDKFYIVTSCSCDRIYHIFGGCVHIYRVLERAPVASDCFPCCYKLMPDNRRIFFTRDGDFNSKLRFEQL